MLITYLANGVFLVENPGNSLIAFHPRWVWFLEQLRKHGVEVPGRADVCFCAGPSWFKYTHTQLYIYISVWGNLPMVKNHINFKLVHAAQIQKVAFWMRKYGCNSWKRTWLWANSNRIAALDRGPLTATEKSTARPTTTRYKNKSGETKFKGNSSLKGSQNLVDIVFVYI